MESTENKELNNEGDVVDENIVKKYGTMSMEELMEALLHVVEQAKDSDVKEDVEVIKITFYKRHKANVEKQRQEFIANGGSEEDFKPESDEFEDQFKELINRYKKVKADLKEESDKQLAKNLEKKQEIIKKLQALIESEDDMNDTLNKFRKLIQQWREIGNVPPEATTELWKTYNLLQEKFYDLIKINHELREYDFKKNLELKTALCEKAEALVDEVNTLSAFQQLQALHEEWKNIGPVAKELREEIWNRFKAASTTINKKYQQYFEEIKEKEKENLKAKEELCEQVESIVAKALANFKEWEDANEQVLHIQGEWKKIGFAPRKDNLKIYERFRSACDQFFKQKNEFYKGIKDEYAENLRKKEELCAKVEVLMDSVDWNETAKQIVELQKEWKEIGQVGKKYSEAVWKRFSTACDHFFARKKEDFTNQKEEEEKNLAAKRELIERVKAYALKGDESDKTAVEDFLKQWNEIGHIPFKVKDKVYSEFRNALSAISSEVRKEEKRVKVKAEASRSQLLRQYNAIMAEIKTIENNLGFFSHSKNAGKLVEGFQKNIEKLKKEAEKIVAQIEKMDKTQE